MRLLLPCCGLAVACTPVPPTAPVPVDPARVRTTDGLYVVHLEARPRPLVAGEATTLTVEIEVDDLPVADTTLAVEPWMPDHGHGVSPAPTVAADLDGVHTATWTYSMPGRWELTLRVDGPDGQDHAKVGYDVQ